MPPWVDRPAQTVISSSILCEKIGTFQTYSSRLTAVLSSICVASLHMHRRMQQPQRGEFPQIRFALEMRGRTSLSSTSARELSRHTLFHLTSPRAVNNGTDIEMGSFVLLNGLADAVEQSLTTVATIDKAVRRALKPLFRVGLFDDIQTVEWCGNGRFPPQVGSSCLS